MFSTKTVAILDPKVFVPGSFITYKIEEYDHGSRDYYSKEVVNGVIRSCEEKRIVVMTALGATATIYMDEIMDSPTFKHGVDEAVLILGVSREVTGFPPGTFKEGEQN
ncbi:hypothetical protein BSP38_149 [Bacillus phage BSP38]|uniref:Uncharacterized protein n=1 Tax=Bacillus phage BSP38 TaxID=2283013 RepID=A0A345MK09_BPBSP|nr:hypothetical protein HWB82_gp169 [Bacillus phage BSP38]AXH71191.1 hypothetical protein BSP38_149 [Bacillus phage BSP38]